MLSYKNMMFFAMAVIVDICLVWVLQYGSLDADMQTLPTFMIVYAAIINIFVIVNIIPFAAIYRAKRQIILKRDLSRILGHRANETSIFLSEGVQRAMRLLLGTNRRPKQGNMAEAATRAADLAYACAKGIAPEMFPEDGRSDTQVLKAADSFWLRRWDPFGQIRQHMFALDTRFSDQKLHPMYLSSGSQGPLMFIWYLALTMAHRYDFEGDWENKPAVLFIDEVENHLHPTWQRRVIPTLLEHFPRLQIFATTHSPFVLAGLKSGQIHRMYRDHEGFVRVHTIDEDTIGWRAEELLTTFMEIDDPTDLARIHRRDTAVALTRGMMGTGRRTGRARSRSMGLKVVGGGHASGQVAAGGGGGRRKRPGGRPEVALAGWAGMSLRDSPWGCPVDGSGA